MKITDYKKTNGKNKISKTLTTARPLDLAPAAGTRRNQKASELFLEREYYKDVMFDDFSNQQKNLFDAWNTSMPYGLLSPSGVPSYPLVQNLQEVSYNRGTPVFALDFVADAFDNLFDDMDTRLAFGNARQISSRESFYSAPYAHLGWTSVEDDYNEHMVGAVFSYFADTYVKEPGNSFKDFSEFIKVYVSYIEKICHQMPITFSAYVKSKYCSPRASGLVIDLAPANANNDRIKYKQFLRDKNYDLFRLRAEKRGFYLDKNIPWRLYANLRHDFMRQKMINNGYFAAGSSGIKHLYNQAFAQTYFEDVTYLRFYLVSYYNAIVDSEPAIYIPSYGCENKAGSLTTIHQRDKVAAFDYYGQIDESSLYARKYGPLFWLRMYYYIRSREDGADLSKKQLDRMTKKFYDLYAIQGFDKTIFAINEHVMAKANVAKVKRLKMMRQDEVLAKAKDEDITPTLPSAGSQTVTSTPSATGGGSMGGGGGY